MLRIVAETYYQLHYNAIELLKSMIGNLKMITKIEEKIKDTEVSLGFGLYLVGAHTFIPGPKEGIGEGVFCW